MQGPKLAVAAGALVAALTSAAIIQAAIAPGSGQSPPRAGDGPVRATTVRVRGTIEHYDAPTRRLRVATPAGPAEFAIPATVHVIRRGTAIDANELDHLTGTGVMVRYHLDADGQVVVTSIHVFTKTDASRP
jgi:hypothetical protein